MKSKYLFRCLFTILGVLMINILSGQLTPTQENQLESILSNPPSAYKLDLEEGNKILNQIDGFFTKNFNLAKVQGVPSKDGQKSSKRIQLSRNVILQPQQVITESSKLKTPITVRYFTEPQGRGFEKKFRDPVSRSLSDSEAFKLAQSFISEHQFTKTTNLDQLIPASVIARKIRTLEPNSDQFRETTVLQRVVLSRQVNQYPVINSRILVDLHPGTKEILGFKTSKWLPVIERKTEEFPLLPKEEILEKIKEGIAGDNAYPYKVRSLQAAYYQTEKHLLPVLELELMPTDQARENGATEQRTLLVFPQKDLPVPGNEKQPRLPEKRS
jgi:hypothetical protein